MRADELAIRLKHARRYLNSLMRKPNLRQAGESDGQTGLFAWVSEDEKCSWPQITVVNGKAAVWLYIPEHEDHADPDPLAMAFQTTSGTIPARNLGAPCAALTWESGELRIVNDVWGFARLYQFDYPGLTLWTTRPGLAAVFAGVAATKTPLAWAGMATLGWNVGGASHLGDGCHLRPASQVVADRISVKSTSRFTEFISDAISRPRPAMNEVAGSMQRVMKNASYFPEGAVADLSGGKDSRVISAACLRSGVTNTLRTVRTTDGEVDTAIELVRLWDRGLVDHQIKEPGVVVPAGGGSLRNRIESLAMSREGNYLAQSITKASMFRGFVPAARASFNGLGGESASGGNLAYAWSARLDEVDPAAAEERLLAFTKTYGSSAEAQEMVRAAVLRRHSEARELGANNIGGYLDYFYNTEKMAYWSLPFGVRSIVMPYYSSAVLPYIAHTLVDRFELGGFHRALLEEIHPPWARVPFYKPSFRERVWPLLWDLPGWNETRAWLAEGVGSLTNFDQKVMRSMLTKIDQGQGIAKFELPLVRAMWELGTDAAVEPLSERARLCAAEVSSILE